MWVLLTRVRRGDFEIISVPRGTGAAGGRQAGLNGLVSFLLGSLLRARFCALREGYCGGVGSFDFAAVRGEEWLAGWIDACVAKVSKGGRMFELESWTAGSGLLSPFSLSVALSVRDECKC